MAVIPFSTKVSMRSLDYKDIEARIAKNPPDVDAIYAAALLALEGFNVRQVDTPEAVRLLARGTQLGDPLCKVFHHTLRALNIGYRLEAPERKKSVEILAGMEGWLQAEADKNHPQAQRMLAILHIINRANDSKKEKKEDAEIEKLFISAAEEGGDLMASYFLGDHYMKRREGPLVVPEESERLYFEAVERYDRAAESGHVGAQFKLGSIYLALAADVERIYSKYTDGSGKVRLDKVDVRDQKLLDVAKRLAEKYWQFDPGVPDVNNKVKDHVKIAKMGHDLMHAAANQGREEAVLQMIKWNTGYYKSSGGPDPEKIKADILKLETTGGPRRQQELGIVRGLLKTIQILTYYWLDIAAEKSNKLGLLESAKCLEVGEGTDKNFGLAIRACWKLFGDATDPLDSTERSSGAELYKRLCAQIPDAGICEHDEEKGLFEIGFKDGTKSVTQLPDNPTLGLKIAQAFLDGQIALDSKDGKPVQQPHPKNMANALFVCRHYLSRYKSDRSLKDVISKISALKDRIEKPAYRKSISASDVDGFKTAEFVDGTTLIIPPSSGQAKALARRASKQAAAPADPTRPPDPSETPPSADGPAGRSKPES